MSAPWFRLYCGYTVQVVGLSHHIYRPGQSVPGYRERGSGSAHLCQSMAACRRWIAADLRNDGWIAAAELARGGAK